MELNSCNYKWGLGKPKSKQFAIFSTKSFKRSLETVSKRETLLLSFRHRRIYLNLIHSFKNTKWMEVLLLSNSQASENTNDNCHWKPLRRRQWVIWYSSSRKKRFQYLKRSNKKAIESICQDSSVFCIKGTAQRQLRCKDHDKINCYSCNNDADEEFCSVQWYDILSHNNISIDRFDDVLIFM